MKHKILLYIIGVTMSLLAGCNSVHELPGEDAVDPTLIHTRIVLLPGADMKTLVTERTASLSIPQSHRVRYVVEVYHDESFNQSLLFRQELFYNEGDASEVALDCELHALRYRVVAWRDYVAADASPDASPDCYYATSDLSAIRLKGDHVGCTDYKDAFSGMQPLDLTAFRNSWHNTYRMELQLNRPLAKVEFVTTDIIKYLDKLEAARAGVIEEMQVEFLYTGYFPAGFDIVLDRPNAAETGVTFRTSPQPLSEREACMAFDYVFVNGDASAIDVEMVIYNADGVEVNRVTGLHVPIRRNYITTVRDEFLTRNYAPGIGINPGFDGEINVVVP